MIAKRGPSAMTAKSSPHAMMSREKHRGRSREEIENNAATAKSSPNAMQRRQRAAPMQRRAAKSAREEAGKKKKTG